MYWIWIKQSQESHNNNRYSFSRDTKQEKAVSTEDDSPTLHNHSPGEQSSLPSPVGQRDYDIPASSLRQKFTFT